MVDPAGIVVISGFRRATDAARGVLRAALDIALPRLCAACREPVEGQGLCPLCWSKLSFISRPYCERLGIPFVYVPGPGILSMEAIADPPAYHRARAAVRFDETSRSLVHALKYGDRLDLAPMLARWLAHAGRELLTDADALVPVPLHWRRYWARRFNQSALLAATVSAMSRRTGHRRRAQAGKADAATGRAIPLRTGSQYAGRVPRAAGRQSLGQRPPPHRRRRRAHLRSDG
jgi:predicted amidophosphoribosyltransferase